jgi:hypothetical protein
MNARMLPSFPYFVKCPSCGVFFKLSREVVVKREGKEIVGYVEFLTIDEYCQAIESGLRNSGLKGSREWKKDILSLRFNLWRAFNESSRNGGIDWKSTVTNGKIKKTVYDENCRAILVAIVDALDDDSLIIRAELHRNLGEFDQCTSTLKKIMNPKEYERYIFAISDACVEKNTLTVKLNDWRDIFEATRSGNLQDVKYFVEREVDVNAKSEQGKTLLFHAVIRMGGGNEIIQYLISKGADVNADNTLHHAVWIPWNLEVVKTLVSSGANVNAKDNNGKTPLDLAKKTEIIEYLESVGAKSGDQAP